jgi:citrate lyase subunit beta / citryl-CoA lyase
VGRRSRARHTAHLRDRGRPRRARRCRDRHRRGCAPLSLGGVDLRRDLNAGDGDLQTLYVRSHLVVVSRAAGLQPPIDSVYPQLDDEARLRAQATLARSLGLFGKSAIHPRQLPVLREVFTPTEDERTWAAQVIDAFLAIYAAA